MTRLAYQTLFDGAEVAVIATSWRRAEHRERARAEAPAAAVEFMRSGSYVRRASGCDDLVDPTVAAFFAAGETFEVEHPLCEENEGTTIRIGPGLAAEIGLPRGRRAVEPTPPELHLRQQRLVAWLATSRARGIEPDPAGAEAAVLALLAAARALRAAPPSHRTLAPATRRAVKTALEFLHATAGERIVLADVAAAAGTSRWHLCRTFAAVTGRSIHRYRSELRLRRAVAALGAGAPDLTRLALELGFASHAHFSDSFRRAFGAAPRALRAELAAGYQNARSMP